jgi:hypothetical protein
MRVVVDWDDPDKRCIRYQFAESWDWDDLYRAFLMARMMERSVGYRVDVILDINDYCACLDVCQFVANNMFVYKLVQQYCMVARSV